MDQTHWIKSLNVQNYGCLKDTAIDFEPFTVLVGPNDSGKSLILKSLEMLGGEQAAAFGRAEDFIGATYGRNGAPIRLTVKGSVRAIEYEYQLAFALPERGGAFLNAETLRLTKPRANQAMILEQKGGQFSLNNISGGQEHGTVAPSRPVSILSEHALPWVTDMIQRLPGTSMEFVEVLSSLASLYRRTPAFRFDVQRLHTPTITAFVPEYGLINRDGTGLAKAFAELLLNDREKLPPIEEALSRAIPTAKRIHVVHEKSTGNYVLQIETPEGTRISTRNLSDGVLLFLAFLLLTLGPEPAPILVIEEPETGIHPGLLEKVVALLKGLTSSQHAPSPVQVILTTHSPVLLNFVDPSEIRVVRRGDEGTKVRPFQDTEGLDKLLEYQGPGEIWFNLGEEQLAGGAKP